jgi:hypothetical protein
MQNQQLQNSGNELENMVLDVNCMTSNLHGENRSLKERLAEETNKCNDVLCLLQPVKAVLPKQLVSFYKSVNECFCYFSFICLLKNTLNNLC